MTEEEEKAIKDCDSIFICLDDAMSEDSANDYRKSYKILKNLIEKQSKEIEELKNTETYKLAIIDKDNYISKDKIKAKIEELKEKNRQGKMRIVQLENEITARIEDVNKYFTPNDKIKAKIEELQEDIQYSANALSIDNSKFVIKVLQSLLEKED